MNQSAIIHEMSVPNFDEHLKEQKKLGKRLSDNLTPLGNSSVQQRSSSRNKQALKYNTAAIQSHQVINGNDFKKDNPMVEMRPLIGKGQIKPNRMDRASMRGLDLPPDPETRDQNEYEMRSSSIKGGMGEKGIGLPGRATQFSVSPWNRTGQPMRSRYVEHN